MFDIGETVDTLGPISVGREIIPGGTSAHVIDVEGHQCEIVTEGGLTAWVDFDDLELLED